jgi:hypothetical protein
MTSSIYGTGTRLCGKRKLKNEEIAKWLREIPLNPCVSIYDYYIATEVISILWVPIIPLETYVFYYSIGEGGFMDQGPTEWVKVYHPDSKSGIYWKHVIINVLPQSIIGSICLLIGHFVLQIF